MRCTHFALRLEPAPKGPPNSDLKPHPQTSFPWVLTCFWKLIAGKQALKCGGRAAAGRNRKVRPLWKQHGSWEEPGGPQWLPA